MPKDATKVTTKVATKDTLKDAIRRQKTPKDAKRRQKTPKRQCTLYMSGVNLILEFYRIHDQIIQNLEQKVECPINLTPIFEIRCLHKGIQM